MTNTGRSPLAEGFACPNCGSYDPKEILDYPTVLTIEVRCTECHDVWIEEVE